MNSVAFGEKARWTVSAGGAAIILASLLLLFRLPQSSTLPGTSAPEASKPAVQIAKAAADALLREETEIRDLRPLFLPTEYNASLPEPRREPGRSFLDDENLKLSFGDTEFTIGRELLAVGASNGKTAGPPAAEDV
jgi:hypothetical protein